MYATVFYEALAMWLYVTISMHILSGSDISACTLSLLIFTGMCLALGFVYYQNMKKKKVFIISDLSHSKTPLSYMIYFQRLYGKIESNDPKANILLLGCLSNHMNYCTVPECKCERIAKSYLKYKEKRQMLD
jgi:hypothetical protein